MARNVPDARIGMKGDERGGEGPFQHHGDEREPELVSAICSALLKRLERDVRGQCWGRRRLAVLAQLAERDKKLECQDGEKEDMDRGDPRDAVIIKGQLKTSDARRDCVHRPRRRFGLWSKNKNPGRVLPNLPPPPAKEKTEATSNSDSANNRGKVMIDIKNRPQDREGKANGKATAIEEWKKTSIANEVYE